MTEAEAMIQDAAPVELDPEPEAEAMIQDAAPVAVPSPSPSS